MGAPSFWHLPCIGGGSVEHRGRGGSRRNGMKRLALLSGLVGLAALAAPLSAQKPREKGDDIPREHRPPPGLCRIWIDNVPAAQQPAPTDCSTAVRNRPANGRVIFGDDYTKREGKGKKV